MDHDGVALINDGGNKEYVERNGQILSTSNENALVNLQKGDIIHKDYDTMIRKSMIMNGAIGGSMVSGENYDGIEMAIDRGFKKAKINNSISVLNESNSYENEMTTWN
jgi:Pyruvate/2-oxoacid:ferredoxin oxidoreductase gamma subunit